MKFWLSSVFQLFLDYERLDHRLTTTSIRLDGRTVSYASREHLSLGIDIMSQYGNFPLWDFHISTTHGKPEVTLNPCVE